MTTTTKNTIEETKAAKNSAFLKALDKAFKAQTTANSAWHEAQKLAVELAAGGYRNLEPANRMIAAIYECKSLRVMSFVKFMLHLAGGENGSITWDAKLMKLGYKRKADSISESMVHYSNLTPFWEHAPESITQLVAFESVITAIKKLRTAATSGKAKATHEELQLLAEMEKLVVKHNPTAFEKKGKK
jgi:hypothetical protein